MTTDPRSWHTAPNAEVYSHSVHPNPRRYRWNNEANTWEREEEEDDNINSPRAANPRASVSSAIPAHQAARESGF